MQCSPEYNFTVGRGLDIGVSGVADDVGELGGLVGRHAGERTRAVVGEVPIDLPGVAEVVGALDQHGRGPKRLEVDDDVGEVELGLEVELDRHVLHAILRLPPRPVRCSKDLKQFNDMESLIVQSASILTLLPLCGRGFFSYRK